MDEHTISPAGDPFYAASRRTDEQESCSCYGGYHYIGHMEIAENGEETEAVRDRGRNDRALPQVQRHRRRRQRVAAHLMCAKYQRRCPALLQLREEALEEWTGAATLHAVLACWGRLGGRVTLHRYGPQHFSELASRRRRPSGTPMQAR